MSGARAARTAADVHRGVAEVAAGFAAERPERQQRTDLRRDDFDSLRAAGLQLVGLPVGRGGLWESMAASARPICEIYRTLASGDPSVALAASMHPAVLGFWLANPDAPGDAAAWSAQCEQVYDTVEAGAWWGTITSEPGSGGDIMRTRATARRDVDGWRISGQKHFGSGSGITAFMITTAKPEGDDDPAWFYVPVAGVPTDGTAGITLVAPWDGHGMQATQSHAFAFDDCPAVRLAWSGDAQDVIAAAAPFFGTLFTAVVLGVVDAAIETARAQLGPKAESLRAYEEVEWCQAELEAWTAAQAYEGALRAIESGRPARGAALRAKTVTAQLGESCLLRLCRVLGGGTYSRRSPFGNWFEDVRALGFLRPPWALAFDGLLADTFEPTVGALATGPGVRDSVHERPGGAS